MKTVPHIVFSGGGTLGHLSPGLAVAIELRQRFPQVRITFASGGKPSERHLVAERGFDYLPLACRPAPRRAGQVLPFVVDNISGYARARRFLAAENVSAVVGLGGYASVPMAYAASRRGIPLVLLEQNAVPGRATRWLAAAATAICLTMETARNALCCRCPVYTTGNPIRERFRPSVSHGNRLLVLGGSGGARSVNEMLPRAFGQLGPALAKWRVIHQTGPADLQSTAERYRELGVPALTVEFIADMPDVLANTALAISRAGGSALAELAAAGVPAILLPYPHAADDHQRRNAEVFDAAGGTLSLDERVLPGRLPYRLATTIATLLARPARRGEMSAAMQRMARPNATAEVAALIGSLVGMGQAGSALRKAA
jgi:UDP-N-acetylglucosamine--N-acetylmuramyl-(pentapeptide) pyrophosphoryl-undecaprenol N-acetylglucosamine transferase